MCRVTMCQTFVHRISSRSLQQRTGVFDLLHYVASRTLLWAGHVARMPKNRLPKRLMLSWVRQPRVSGGQEVTFGRSLSRYLNHFDLPVTYAEWAVLAQDRAGWYKRVTTAPFVIGKPFLRQPRGDTRLSAEDKGKEVARRKAEIKERRALFTANAITGTSHEQPRQEPSGAAHSPLKIRNALTGYSVDTHSSKFLTRVHTTRTCPTPPLTLDFLRHARALTSTHSIGFCVIRVCISSNS